MAITKKVNTDYTIDATDHQVTILGNLTVTGATTTVSSTDTEISDKVIVLNSGETGAGISTPSPAAGIQIDRGSLPDAFLVFDEILDVFAISYDGVTFTNIATTSGSGTGSLENVVEDTTPQLGGNLETNGFHLQFDATTIEPSVTANATVIYQDTVGSAGSGLYVKNSGTSDGQELVTKAKAIVFSLIL